MIIDDLAFCLKTNRTVADRFNLFLNRYNTNLGVIFHELEEQRYDSVIGRFIAFFSSLNIGFNIYPNMIETKDYNPPYDGHSICSLRIDNQYTITVFNVIVKTIYHLECPF